MIARTLRAAVIARRLLSTIDTIPENNQKLAIEPDRNIDPSDRPFVAIFS